MRITDTSDLWWKTAVIYCLDVETFLDWNDDGTGDFPGLAQRLDYLASLGVTCLWLMPFYPTPDRDDGYDIIDFYGVDPRLGTLGDLVEVIRTARDRGMRVIADLVVNHTSDQHPWFKAARASRNSQYRDFYVWADQPPADAQAEPTFPDQETSVWTFDEQAGQYYLHRFYKHQPDLNVANPLVRDEIAKIMGFWLQLGLSGFRVDAVPFFLETMGVPDGDAALPDPHEYLRDLRAFLEPADRRRHPARRGQPAPRSNSWSSSAAPTATSCTCSSTSSGCSGSTSRWPAATPRPLVEALTTRPQPQPESQWASFVRNHDELTLDKLSEAERQEVFAAFGPEPEMQVYGRGLIRRLPPMLGGDPRRIRMVYSLLFSLPGTPVLFYGEEIGMGENLEAGDRLAVRTPMQWSTEKNGGFSNAAPATGCSGQLPEGAYGPEFVNVTDQQRDPDSLLNFIRTLARRYRDCPELGWGTLRGAGAAVRRGAGPPLHLGRRLDRAAAQPRRPMRSTVPAHPDELEPTAPGSADLLDRRLGRARRQGPGGAAAGGVRLPLAAGHTARAPAASTDQSVLTPSRVQRLSGRLEHLRRLGPVAAGGGMVARCLGQMGPDLDQRGLPGRALPEQGGPLRGLQVPPGILEVTDVGARLGRRDGEHDGAERTMVVGAQRAPRRGRPRRGPLRGRGPRHQRPVDPHHDVQRDAGEPGQRQRPPQQPVGLGPLAQGEMHLGQPLQAMCLAGRRTEVAV